MSIYEQSTHIREQISPSHNKNNYLIKNICGVIWLPKGLVIYLQKLKHSNMSKKTIHVQVKRDNLPVLKVGDRVEFMLDGESLIDVITYINGNCIEGKKYSLTGLKLKVIFSNQI